MMTACASSSVSEATVDKCERDTQQYNERLCQAVADAVVGQLVPAVRGMATVVGEAVQQTARVFTATFGPLAQALATAKLGRVRR